MAESWTEVAMDTASKGVDFGVDFAREELGIGDDDREARAGTGEGAMEYPIAQAQQASGMSFDLGRVASLAPAHAPIMERELVVWGKPTGLKVPVLLALGAAVWMYRKDLVKALGFATKKKKKTMLIALGIVVLIRATGLDEKFMGGM